jgi:exodeoxyribonuclease VII large subunit
MSGRVELDGERLKITFPYREDLVQVVRCLEGRAWDRDQRAWFVPSTQATRVVELFREHRFIVDEAVVALCAEPASDQGALEPTALDSLTVSQLNAQARDALQRAFPAPVWLIGEVVGFDRNRHKRHVHFELVEKDRNGAQARATVTAVLFESEWRALESRLAAAQVPFALRDGLEVRLLVRVELYGPSGSYQIVVQDVDPVHTLGKLALAREAVLAELERRGVRERNRRLELPRLPLRVGLITSHGSDAYNDFVNELERAGFAFAVTVHDALMQGRDFKSSMLRALDYFSSRASELDVLAIVRGGGARTDLAWFDDLQVALAVAHCPIKVITGIGHTRDVSVIDLITHSEKTPTAAAQCLVGLVRSTCERLEQSWSDLTAKAALAVRAQQRAIGASGARLERGVSAGLERVRLLLCERRARLAGVAQLACQQRRIDTRRRSARVSTCARACLREGARELARCATRLTVERLARPFTRLRARLDELDRRRALLDPSRLLARGYALVLRAGRLLARARDVAPGEEVVVRLQDGEVTSTVTDVKLAQGGDANGEQRGLS